MAYTVAWCLPVLVLLITIHKGSSVIVEKGQPTNLQCTFPNNVTSVTWQLLNGGTSVNLSTCSVVDNRCTDYVPSLYHGFTNSGNNKIFGLLVLSARTNETQFLCLSNNGLQSNVSMEVYAWPTSPICYEEINTTYVDYTCYTDNVYPNVTVVLHRREKELTNADFDPSFTQCTHEDYGIGSAGDFRISCHWRIKIENMLLNNTIYVEMTAVVSNMSVTNRTAALSNDTLTNLYAPEVRKSLLRCPFGPGVHMDSILIGTTAQCECELAVAGVPEGYARWFTRDGRIVDRLYPANQLSMLEVSYNYSDPDQSYECRPITPLRVNVTSVVYAPKFASNFMIMEKGQPLNLECSFPNDVTTITWQLFDAPTTYNLSICSLVDKNCTDLKPLAYTGNISSSEGKISVGLNIIGLQHFDTQFWCLADNGLKSNITQLEVYAWPNDPVCYMYIGRSYVDYSCNTTNVFPNISSAVLRRREKELTNADFEPYQPKCFRDTGFTGTEGDYRVRCDWRILFENMLLNSTIFVEMTGYVSNMSGINKTAAVSNDTLTELRVPEVTSLLHCPFGPGVHMGSIIIGKTAQCACELNFRGIPAGYARWFTRDGRIVEELYPTTKISVLEISYNKSDPNQSYECRPITKLKENVTSFIYTPKFIIADITVVEEEKSTTLECSFPTNVTSIMWQMFSGNTTYNISTCNFVNNSCNDLWSTLYKYRGYNSSSASSNSMGLIINNVIKNETQFSCLADNGLTSIVNLLEVYAYPTRPICYHDISKTYVDYTCYTDNVYTNVTVVLHRREKELTNADFDSDHTECIHAEYGIDSYVGYRVTCHWRIPMENMLLNNTLFLEVTPLVSNMTAINRTATLGSDTLIKLYVPEVRRSLLNCPIGPGVHVDSILIGTTAQCECELAVGGMPAGYARWFTRDGKIIEEMPQTNQLVMLEVSYNYSDPSQSYECRPITLLNAYITPFIYTPKFAGDLVIVESGQALNLKCIFPNDVASITWQMLYGLTTYNLSICSLGDNKCIDLQPQVYKGFSITPANKNSVGLNIISVRSNETQFLCLADTGLKTNITQLEVYSLPKKPSCKQEVYATYISYDCTSETVYPFLNAEIHRRGVDFTRLDYISYGTIYNKHPEGDFYSVSVAWRVFIDGNILDMNVYVKLTPVVSDVSLNSKTAVISDDIVTKLRTPEVVVNNKYCPLGPGVRGETIKIGTTATCRCDIKTQGLPPGFARWFVHTDFRVGEESDTDSSSTLTLSYNSSDPNKSYECRSQSVLKGNVSIVTYKPIFTSSAQHVVTTGLHPLIMILGVVCSGILSRLVCEQDGVY